MRLVERPHLMCDFMGEGLSALGNSACNDLANRNALGFITRQRQIQELYVKSLYLLLLADPNEQAHIVSGDMPNGLAGYYRKVNEMVFSKQDDWEAVRPGLNEDRFTIMDTLNDGAHVSFKSLMMARSYFNRPESVMTPERFAAYIRDRLIKITYMKGMFASGKPREHVLDGVRAMHQPASYWEEQQRAARGAE
jgi:hypothetical protein